MKLTREPYVLIHALHWRRDGAMIVVSQRHGQLLLETFEDANPAQQWYLGINGEIYTSIRDQQRYIHHSNGCLDVNITPTPGGDWAFDSLGEHPYKYRIVPRSCPNLALRATYGSLSVGLEAIGYMDDSNGWYVIPLRDMAEKRVAHVRPVV